MANYNQVPELSLHQADNNAFGNAATNLAAGEMIPPLSVELRKHGQSEGHSPYGCTCGTKFTRLDALNRHITTHYDAPQYPCGYCYARRGEKGFPRRDNLVQHLKGFHGIDTADKLVRHEPESRRTTTTPASGHLESLVLSLPPFPCPMLGCTKMGVDGYLRMVDLDEHLAMMHHPYPIQDNAYLQELQVPIQSSQLEEQSYQAPMQPYQPEGQSGFTF
ncbi:hypothetical protein F4677DRAFT_445168 [Hypoxylon crocopeplum]|nr:hypothetical protein F4677DRAFT_445168 [Hypoxylon crocopeplum]